MGLIVGKDKNFIHLAAIVPMACVQGRLGTSSPHGNENNAELARDYQVMCRLFSFYEKARSSSLNDVACLTATMDLLENGMGRLITNANGWAVGDIARIDMDSVVARDRLCLDAFGSSSVAMENGIPDAREAMMAKWLSLAQGTLVSKRNTVSVLPIGEIIAADGYAARLRALGYEIASP